MYVSVHFQVHQQWYCATLVISLTQKTSGLLKSCQR
jgi:hypothetical protein